MNAIPRDLKSRTGEVYRSGKVSKSEVDRASLEGTYNIDTSVSDSSKNRHNECQTISYGGIDARKGKENIDKDARCVIRE